MTSRRRSADDVRGHHDERNRSVGKRPRSHCPFTPASELFVRTQSSSYLVVIKPFLAPRAAFQRQQPTSRPVEFDGPRRSE